VTLVERYEKLSIEYACATNSISCIVQLDKSNCELKAQVEDLTSKHVGLQEKYDDLSFTHEKLVDSHAMLDITHEVMKTSVKFYQPHMYKCICETSRSKQPELNMYLNTRK
jgi:predicted nuclease with TOPRIM domain